MLGMENAAPPIRRGTAIRRRGKRARDAQMAEMCSPVENNVAEGAGIAATAEEEVPNRVSKVLSLRIRRETDDASRAPKGERDGLAGGLTRLDIIGDRVALEELRSGEDTPRAAGLTKESILILAEAFSRRNARWQSQQQEDRRFPGTGRGTRAGKYRQCCPGSSMKEIAGSRRRPDPNICKKRVNTGEHGRCLHRCNV